MHDLKALRDNPAAYDQNWARRGLSPQTPIILELDEKRRALQTELQTAQNRRNEASKEIGAVKSKGGDASELMAEVASLKDRMAILEEQEKDAADKLNEVLSALPNMVASDVPDGADENDNVEIRTYGTPKQSNSVVPDHVAIGEALGMMDFEAAAKMSGSRFVLLKAGLAQLERALAQFMLDVHTTLHGYEEISPPLLVKAKTLYGTGQLPKFSDDLFKTDPGSYLQDKLNEKLRNYSGPSLVPDVDPTKESARQAAASAYADSLYKNISEEARLWLIPTAEVSLTNIVADSILEEDKFPRRYTACTPCFRSEAGSAGKDTRGIIRQHQFYKVEMVSITRPEDSDAEHQRMTDCAENILKKLELPFRTIVLCAGDMGFGSCKTYDIEVWVPSQNKYREISSCSNCGNFQSRRMKTRFKRAGAKDTEFVHTLNGSGVAVGRALVAVMENYYDPTDGGIFVPEVLKPYMRGITKIVKAS